MFADGLAYRQRPPAGASCGARASTAAKPDAMSRKRLTTPSFSSGSLEHVAHQPAAWRHTRRRDATSRLAPPRTSGGALMSTPADVRVATQRAKIPSTARRPARSRKAPRMAAVQEVRLHDAHVSAAGGTVRRSRSTRRLRTSQATSSPRFPSSPRAQWSSRPATRTCRAHAGRETGRREPIMLRGLVLTTNHPCARPAPRNDDLLRRPRRRCEPARGDPHSVTLQDVDQF